MVELCVKRERCAPYFLEKRVLECVPECVLYRCSVSSVRVVIRNSPVSEKSREVCVVLGLDVGKALEGRKRWMVCVRGVVWEGRGAVMVGGGGGGGGAGGVEGVEYVGGGWLGVFALGGFGGALGRREVD